MQRTLLVAALLATTLVPSVHAETTACTAITTLPKTITTSGVYCLKQHLATSVPSGVAINIAADNVVLDLNGFRLDGIAAGTATQATGIWVAAGHVNTVVRNGTVRGFMTGLRVDGGSSHLVEALLLADNRCSGIWLIAHRSTIRDSSVL